MKKVLKLKLLLITVLCLTLLYNCKKKEETVPTPTHAHLKFNFSHSVDGVPLKLDSIKYLNKAGNPYSIINLRYFISNITLHSGSDSLLINDVHYVDVVDNSTFTYAPSKEIANGSYDYISFVFGLDATKNITNHFVNPPESNMTWPVPMGGGYHYMQLEGKFDSSGVIKNYEIHTGALMSSPYYIYISLLQSSFKLEGKDVIVNVAMNINEWFENPNTYDFNIYDGAMMSVPAAQLTIQQNGVDVFSVKSIQ
jgi:hypothetical protein